MTNQSDELLQKIIEEMTYYLGIGPNAEEEPDEPAEETFILEE